MGTHPFRQLALAAAVSIAAISQASAGGCCSCGVSCGVPGRYIPVVDLPNIAVAEPIYVVNHGPVYTGPGIVTYSGFYSEYGPVAIYPYSLGGYRVGHPWFGGRRPYVKRAYWYR